MLVERYEYTPNGQRTVFFSPGLNDPGCNASTSISRRRTYAGENQPWGLCAIGHQGLMHDEETGNIYNRARMLSGMRFMQRDPLGYVDGMGLYQYLKASPMEFVDPLGLCGFAMVGLPYPIDHGFMGDMIDRAVRQGTWPPQAATNGDCKCGPDVTKSFDELFERLLAEFKGRDVPGRAHLCASLSRPDGWDIEQLAGQGVTNQSCGSGTGTCSKTVTIWGACYRQEAANYFLYGLGHRLCWDDRLS